MRVCSLRYPACNAHAPYCHLWPAPLYNIVPHYLIKALQYCPTLTHKRHDFRGKKKVINTKCVSYVYWTVHHLDSWIKIDQLMSLASFFAQHVSNVCTFIFLSLRLCVGILLWFDVCWRYGVVRLGWCGILMQAEAVNKDRPTWCHLLYYFTIYCSTCFECKYIHLQELAT